MLSVSMIKDLNDDTDNSAPSDMLNVGATLYFSAQDSVAGRELWRSDGTAGGTFRVADIVPGKESSHPRPIVALGGNRLLLRVNDNSLWVSDGTAAGTQKLADVVPTPYAPIGVAGGRAFFTVHTPATGTELWTSDGTAGGTRLVKDIFPGTSGSSVNWPVVSVGGVAYFSADDGVHGAEPWRSDGTEAGTYMIKDVRPGPAGSVINNMAALGNSVYFVAYDGVHAKDLWKTDGTAAGTVRRADLWYGGLSHDPGLLYRAGNALYWVDKQSGLLIGSDGTHLGTRDIAKVSYGVTPTPFYDVNGLAYFFVGDQLWRSDGTGAGTFVVKSGAYSVHAITRAYTHLFFVTVDNGGYEPKLWRSDGTIAGTTLVDAPSFAQFGGVLSFDLTGAGANAYFSANGPGVGRELYKVGPGARSAALVKDIDDSRPFGSGAKLYRTVGQYTYFLTRQDGEYSTYSLWRTDGTASGTVFLFDTGFAARPSLKKLDAMAFGDEVLLKVGNKLWLTGPEPGSQRALFHAPAADYLSPPVVLGNKIYFAATESGPPYRNQLWVSDGQTASLFPLPSTVSTLPGLGNLTVSGGLLYFTAQDTANGVGLWRTDGTPAGTDRISAAVPEWGFPWAEPTFDLNGTMYFIASGDGGKRRLWKSDGTAAGTAQVAPSLAVAHDGNYHTPMGALGGLLYLPASLDGGTGGVELWRTDGTPGGTGLVKDLNPGTGGSIITEFEPLGDKLFFVAQNQLYVTDGTDAGTLALAPHLNQNTTPEIGLGYKGPQQLTAVGRFLYFVAGDNVRGIELCRSDGTPAGTMMVEDLYPGSAGGLYHGGTYLKGITTLAALGDAVIFGASDGVLGWEPWTARYDVARIHTASFEVGRAPQRLEFKLSADVGASVSESDFSLRDAVTNDILIPPESGTVVWDAATRTVTWTYDLNGGILPDGNYRMYVGGDGVIDVNGVPLDGDGDGVPGGDFAFDFHVLAADANRDRRVDFNDLAILAQNYNTTGKSFAQGNFDYDPSGNVDFDDLALLAQRYNTSLPPPTAGAVALASQLPESTTGERPARPAFNPTVPVQRKKPPKHLARRAP